MDLFITDCPPDVDLCETCRRECTREERATCEMRRRQEELLIEQRDERDTIPCPPPEHDDVT